MIRRGGLALWGAVIVFIVTQVVYLATVTRTSPFWDSGEFIATSYILGIPHPPGTPLYVLIGRVFTMLPLFGDIASRVNYLSAFASSLAASFTFLLVWEFYRVWGSSPSRGGTTSGDASGPSSLNGLIGMAAGLVAAFFTAFSRTFWDNAVEAEVYALSNLIMTVSLWLIVRWARPGDRTRRAGLFALLYYLLCISMGIHLGVFLVLPGIVLYALLVDRRLFGESWFGAMATAGVLVLLHPAMLPNLGVFVWGLTLGCVLLGTAASFFMRVNPSLGPRGILTWAALAAVIGVSSHAYLMIRANLDPAINEADPSSWEALWKMLIRDQYKPPNPFLVRKASWAIQFDHHFWRYAQDQYALGFKPASLAMMIPYSVGIVGAVGQAWRDRKGFMLMLVTYLITSVGLVFYLNFREQEVRDRDYFFVASFQMFTVWIGLGAAFLLEEARALLARAGQGRTIAVGALATLFVVFPFGTMRTYWFTHDRTEFFVAADFGYNVLQTLEPNAIIFTNGDNDTFPLWYMQEVEHFRKDVRVVNLSLLNTDWYLRQLRDYEPKVDLGWNDEEIQLAALFGGIMMAYQDGQISKDRLMNFVQRSGLRPYIRTFDEPIITKDVAAARIIEREYGKRPIYLALTVPDQMGLDPRLVQKGCVMKIEEPIGHEPRVDVAETVRLLRDEYRYRGVLENGKRNPRVFKDENATKLLQNYAASYLEAAQDLLRAGRPDEAIQLGLTAREIAPQAGAVHYSLALLYRQLEDYPAMEASVRTLAEMGSRDPRVQVLLAEALELQGKDDEAAEIYKATLASSPEDWDTHRELFRLFWQDLKRPEDALAVLDHWLAGHPNDPSVREARRMYGDSAAAMAKQPS